MLGFTGRWRRLGESGTASWIVELESRAFSRGSTSTKTSEDAIVNRRMYRKWSERVGISRREAGRRGCAGTAKRRSRGSREHGRNSQNWRTPNAKAMQNHAKAMQTGCKRRGEVVRRRGLRKARRFFSDAKMPIPTQPNPTNPNPTQPRGEKGAPRRLGRARCAGHRRQIALSPHHQGYRDEGLRARWWNHAVNAFRDRKQLARWTTTFGIWETKGGGTRTGAGTWSSGFWPARELKVGLRMCRREVKYESA